VRRSKTLLPPASESSYAAPPSFDGFDALRTAMTMCALQLEAAADELGNASLQPILSGFVRSACALRDLLARLPAVAAECAPPSDTTVVESVRWAYAWAIEQIDSVRGVVEASVDDARVLEVRREIGIAHDAFRTLNGILRAMSARGT
jgi:hypothetical protein